MQKSLLRTDKEIAEIYQRHGPVFESEKHEEAWLVRTAGNLCKNSLKHWWRRNEPLEEYTHLHDGAAVEIDSTLEAVMGLPDKYKTVVYLFYYERYSGEEIAAILHKPQSTVRSHLCEARIILKRKLGGGFDEP